MVKVRTFGTFRLDTGIKELDLEVSNVKELLDAVAARINTQSPESGVDRRSLKGCIVSVNGRQVRTSARLADGDEVWLVPAVAGG